MWTIDPVDLKLVNHHTGSKYAWGLAESSPTGSLYVIKDISKCAGKTWYNPVKKTENPLKGQIQPSARRKRQAASGTPLECPTQTFMGHTITPKELSEGNETQIWKMKLSDIKGKKGPYQTSQYFKLFIADKEETSTLKSTDKDSSKKKEKPKDTYLSADKPNVFHSTQDCEGIIAANVKNFRTFEDNTKKVLTVLLGFFVATIVKRWWDQTSKIPRLEKLAISLNAIMQEGKNLIYEKNSLNSKILYISSPECPNAL